MSPPVPGREFRRHPHDRLYPGVPGMTAKRYFATDNSKSVIHGSRLRNISVVSQHHGSYYPPLTYAILDRLECYLRLGVWAWPIHSRRRHCETRCEPETSASGLIPGAQQVWRCPHDEQQHELTRQGWWRSCASSKPALHPRLAAITEPSC